MLSDQTPKVGHELRRRTLMLRPAPMETTPGPGKAPVSKAERWRKSRRFR